MGPVKSTFLKLKGLLKPVKITFSKTLVVEFGLEIFGRDEQPLTDDLQIIH